MATVVVERHTGPGAVGPDLRAELLACWVDVTRAGGAVGFPAADVDAQTVAPVLDALLDGLSGDLLVARRAGPHEDGALVGWVHLRTSDDPLVAHWATVERLQVRPEQQGSGAGTALLDACAARGRERGLDHLWLTARSGLGLEAYYVARGWRVSGVHEGALRVADGVRDQVQLRLDLRPAVSPAP